MRMRLLRRKMRALGSSCGFFFQAEDGIRDLTVTGVQTCALPISGQSGVADVQFDRTWLARLMGVVNSARMAGAVVAGVLMLGAAFTVGAVVRLSLYARRDELEIMALVGAPFSYIRGPFVCEGLLLGGLGAAVALMVVREIGRAHV